MNYSKIILLGLILGLLSGALGHSYLTKPTSRSNQKDSTTGCRGPACLGPCDVTKAKAKTAAITIQRGASINLQWPRNNHAGGFIRIAWAQTANSDTHASFDANVQTIFCHERGGCKPDNANDPNGGDSAPADGSFQPCQSTITVPPHLTDGTWTLQWAWFGGAFALGDYYSCVDYVISGGASGSAPAATFVGGDFSYPNQQKCKFFNTDRLHRCVNEPCDNPVYSLTAQQSGPAFGISSTPAPASITTGKPVTTGKPPVTTGRSITTGKATTGSASPTPAPITTGSAQITTGAPSPAPINTENCAGATTLSDSTASIVSVDTWGTTLRAVVELHVQEATLSNWMIQVIWPSNAVSTRVSAVFNAGLLQCEGTTPTRHAIIRPVAVWANNLKAGTVVTIEIMATNTNMNSQFIKANTQLKVFKA